MIVNQEVFFDHVKENLILIELTPENWRPYFALSGVYPSSASPPPRFLAELLSEGN